MTTPLHSMTPSPAPEVEGGQLAELMDKLRKQTMELGQGFNRMQTSMERFADNMGKIAELSGRLTYLLAMLGGVPRSFAHGAIPMVLYAGLHGTRGGQRGSGGGGGGGGGGDWPQGGSGSNRDDSRYKPKTTEERLRDDYSHRVLRTLGGMSYAGTLKEEGKAAEYHKAILALPHQLTPEQIEKSAEYSNTIKPVKLSAIPAAKIPPPAAAYGPQPGMAEPDLFAYGEAQARKEEEAAQASPLPGSILHDAHVRDHNAHEALSGPTTQVGPAVPHIPTHLTNASYGNPKDPEDMEELVRDAKLYEQSNKDKKGLSPEDRKLTKKQLRDKANALLKTPQSVVIVPPTEEEDKALDEKINAPGYGVSEPAPQKKKHTPRTNDDDFDDTQGTPLPSVNPPKKKKKKKSGDGGTSLASVNPFAALGVGAAVAGSVGLGTVAGIGLGVLAYKHRKSIGKALEGGLNLYGRSLELLSQGLIGAASFVIGGISTVLTNIRKGLGQGGSFVGNKAGSLYRKAKAVGASVLHGVGNVGLGLATGALGFGAVAGAAGLATIGGPALVAGIGVRAGYRTGKKVLQAGGRKVRELSNKLGLGTAYRYVASRVHALATGVRDKAYAAGAGTAETLGGIGSDIGGFLGRVGGGFGEAVGGMAGLLYRGVAATGGGLAHGARAVARRAGRGIGAVGRFLGRGFSAITGYGEEDPGLVGPPRPGYHHAGTAARNRQQLKDFFGIGTSRFGVDRSVWDKMSGGQKANTAIQSMGAQGARSLVLGGAMAGGALSSGAPDVFATLKGSISLFTGEIGSALIPASVALSAKFQDLAAWVRGLDEPTKALYVSIAKWTLYLAGGALVLAKIVSIAGTLYPVFAGIVLAGAAVVKTLWAMATKGYSGMTSGQQTGLQVGVGMLATAGIAASAYALTSNNSALYEKNMKVVDHKSQERIDYITSKFGTEEGDNKLVKIMAAARQRAPKAPGGFLGNDPLAEFMKQGNEKQEPTAERVKNYLPVLDERETLIRKQLQEKKEALQETASESIGDKFGQFLQKGVTTNDSQKEALAAYTNKQKELENLIIDREAIIRYGQITTAGRTTPEYKPYKTRVEDETNNEKKRQLLFSLSNQTQSTPQYSAVEEVYKKIQLTALGNSPLDYAKQQQTLDAQLKTLKEIQKYFTDNDPLKPVVTELQQATQAAKDGARTGQ